MYIILYYSQYHNTIIHKLSRIIIVIKFLSSIIYLYNFIVKLSLSSDLCLENKDLQLFIIFVQTTLNNIIIVFVIKL